MDRDDFDHAIDFFRESVQLDDVNKSAKTGLSEALALKGNDTLIRDGIPASKPFFEEALKYNPQNSRLISAWRKSIQSSTRTTKLSGITKTLEVRQGPDRDLYAPGNSYYQKARSLNPKTF